MNNIEIMEYWLKSANRDYETMKVMFDNHKNTWCLFIGHLVIEKILKALYAKNNKDNPYTIKSHNLLALAEKCQLNLSEEKINKLQQITQLNIIARYDDYKESFFEKCTDEYTKMKVKEIEEVYEWLKKLLMVK